MPLLLALACSHLGDVAPSPHAGLAPCPESPNCVSSLALPEDEAHHIYPLPLHGTAEQSIEALQALVLAMPDTALISRSPTSLHTSFTSATFHFVDDVQFVADDAAGVVHLRSASRVGYGDMGVNRERVERIRSTWQAAVAPTPLPPTP